MSRKTFVVVNGPMGVGKTATCRALHLGLDRAVWLDGDWCWQMHPWVFSEENRRMVIDNITHLLRNFLASSSFDHVIFSWVLHLPGILEDILGRLEGLAFELVEISLVCSERCLEARMREDGRSQETIAASLQRLALYRAMDTIQVDTTDLPLGRVVEKLRELVLAAR
jgi:hypothetical protein